MEAANNTSPRDLRPNVDYKATLWAADSRVLATVWLRLLPETDQGYDGILDIIDEECPVSPTHPAICVSVGNYQIASIQPVDGSVRDRHNRIPFIWVDTSQSSGDQERKSYKRHNPKAASSNPLSASCL